VSPWLRWAGRGIWRLILKPVALVVVPFLDDEQRVSHPIWGARDATDTSWKNIAWTNGVHNYNSLPSVPYFSKGDEDMEMPGVKVRHRVSKDGKYVSYRRTWGKARVEGKKEFYIGWTMNETDYMRPTLQLRR